MRLIWGNENYIKNENKFFGSLKIRQKCIKVKSLLFFSVDILIFNNFLMNKSPSKAKFDVKPFLRPGVTEEQIISIKENFDMFDTQKSGSIDPKKIKQIISHKGAQVQNKGIYQLICDLDSEGSGNITFDQFIHLNTRRLIQNDSRQNIKYIFTLFDDEKSGFITIKSLRRKARDLGLDLDEKDFEDMVAVADQDRDGLISQEQFYQFVSFSTAH